jgi:hypothetical protein
LFTEEKAGVKYLFVCGAPRSGTTAMWRLLASDRRIVMGVERYGNLFFKESLTKELFTYERFSNLLPGDTFYDDLSSFNPYYDKLEALFSQAVYVGDKLPLLYRHLDSLLSNIVDAKIVFMLRNIFDVCASYEARANDPEDAAWPSDKRTPAAIEDWWSALRVLKDHANNEQVFPVIFEDVFSSSGKIDNLFEFLELDITSDVAATYKALLARGAQLEKIRKRDLATKDVRLICETAPFGLYREVLKGIATKTQKST